jgi:lysozyme
MQLSQAGLSLLKQCEGLRLYVYKDIAGIPTIGYGHRLLKTDSYPNGITEEQAETILQNDLASTEGALTRLVKVPLTQGQFDALVDFTFNLGAARLAGSTLLRLLNAGQYDEASSQLRRWDHSGPVEVEQLKNRRESEYKLWHG